MLTTGYIAVSGRPGFSPSALALAKQLTEADEWEGLSPAKGRSPAAVGLAGAGHLVDEPQRHYGVRNAPVSMCETGWCSQEDAVSRELRRAEIGSLGIGRTGARYKMHCLPRNASARSGVRRADHISERRIHPFHLSPIRSIICRASCGVFVVAELCLKPFPGPSHFPNAEYTMCSCSVLPIADRVCRSRLTTRACGTALRLWLPRSWPTLVIAAARQCSRGSHRGAGPRGPPRRA